MLVHDFIPAADGRSRNLLIMMHGLGDSIEGYRWLPSALGLPNLNYALVNAPDSYYGGYSWYNFAEDPGPGVKRSRELILEMVEDFQKKGFNANRMFIGGFSQGCLMTIDVGLRSPHLFAGLIGISGYVHEPAQLLQELSPTAKRQQLLLTHGSQDTLIPMKAVRIQVDQLRAGGIQIEWHEFAKAHTIAGEPELAVIRRFITKQLAAAPDV